MLNTTTNASTTNASTTFTSSTLTDELIDDTILPTTTIDDRSDIDHHTTTSIVPIGDEEYSTVRIQDDLWNQRIQDIGCTKDLLPLKTYKRSQIPPIGPVDSQLFYFHLTAIAIDYFKVFGTDSVLGRGWAKVPKNKSDAKVKIIGVILALRKENTDGKFVLDQTCVLSIFF